MALDVPTGEPRAWIVRAGREGRYERLALDHDVALIGWVAIGPIDAAMSRADLKEAIRRTLGEERPASLASQAGQVYRFVHEIQEGDTVVLPLMSDPGYVAIGRVTGPYRWREDPDFASEDARNTRDVEWIGRRVPYESADPDLREAFGQQGTVSEITKPGAAKRLVALATGPPHAALHLLLRWSPSQNPRTIELHREIAERRGAVWWGKIGDPRGRAAVGADKRRTLRNQLREGRDTSVYLVRPGEEWRARLLDISTDRPDREADLIPSYYRDVVGQHHLWLKLGDFDLLPQGFVERELTLDDGRSVAKAFKGQSSLFYVRRGNGGGASRTGSPKRLTVDAVKETTEAPPYQLLLQEELHASAVAALQSGKHVILTGPPGTAKTTFAQALADTAKRLGLCRGYVLTTATADWTTYETIGGLKPTPRGELEFAPGHFLQAIEDQQWLVIDELNRSQFDRAFGQLFTVLSGQPVTLPYTRRGKRSPLMLVPAGVPPPSDADDVLTIPSNWRIVATMNVFDKTLLFEMSYALMRRFAFIEVPSPEPDTFDRLIGSWSGGSDRAAETAKALLAVRDVKDIGPAVYRDIARFAAERLRLGEVGDGELRFQAFFSYLLPQFEGISEEQGERLVKRLSPLVGARRREKLRRTLNEVLGLELTTQGDDEPADPEADEHSVQDDASEALPPLPQ